MPPDLAFNTATSFVTNTNWQAYSGESTLSYFVQMAALAVQNFASAAAGMAIAVALIRGFARQERRTIGNFWVDVTRATVYVLLPISIVAGLLYVSQGAVQNLNPSTEVTTVEGAKQTIAQGPTASQEAIKQLGTNGGGFFNANSAHPYENLTPLSNLLAMTGISQVIFPHQANGSLIKAGDKVIGSEIIGENFTKPEYFHPRPSPAGTNGYDGTASGGSNYGATNKKLVDRISASLDQFKKENPDYHGPIPSDLVTGSASGLDPHISPDSAQAQVARVAKARGVSAEQTNQLVGHFTEGRAWAFWVNRE